jgi:hypothetical protein
VTLLRPGAMDSSLNMERIEKTVFISIAAPTDTKVTPISRTVGVDQVVGARDAFLEIDTLLVTT